MEALCSFHFFRLRFSYGSLANAQGSSASSSRVNVAFPTSDAGSTSGSRSEPVLHASLSSRSTWLPLQRCRSKLWRLRVHWSTKNIPTEHFSSVGVKLTSPTERFPCVFPSTLPTHRCDLPILSWLTASRFCKNGRRSHGRFFLMQIWVVLSCAIMPTRCC